MAGIRLGAARAGVLGPRFACAALGKGRRDRRRLGSRIRIFQWVAAHFGSAPAWPLSLWSKAGEERIQFRNQVCVGLSSLVAPGLARKARGVRRCFGSRIQTFQRVAAHSGSLRALPGRNTVDEKRGQIDVRQWVARVVFRKGRGVDLGSRNETFQELATRFGSLRAAAKAVIAVKLAQDLHHTVDRREVCARHRVEADEQSLVEAAQLHRDELAGRLGRAARDEVADIFA